jgi:hypothetical protein
MKGPKIHFSEAESKLMKNAEIILTKNVVLEKVRALLEDVQREQVDFVKGDASAGPLFSIPPKISKGENYRGLPYKVLDFPRLFGQEDIFAVRLLFWWGHYFSATLHLSGRYKSESLPSIIQNLPLLSQKGYYLGIHPDPWLHHFESDTYRPLSEFNEKQFLSLCSSLPHLKIAKSLPLEDVISEPGLLFGSWKFLLEAARCKLRAES